MPLLSHFLGTAGSVVTTARQAARQAIISTFKTVYVQTDTCHLFFVLKVESGTSSRVSRERKRTKQCDKRRQCPPRSSRSRKNIYESYSTREGRREKEKMGTSERQSEGKRCTCVELTKIEDRVGANAWKVCRS